MGLKGLPDYSGCAKDRKDGREDDSSISLPKDEQSGTKNCEGNPKESFFYRHGITLLLGFHCGTPGFKIARCSGLAIAYSISLEEVRVQFLQCVEF